MAKRIKHGFGTTTFRVKNPTHAKHGSSMGVLQHTKNKPLSKGIDDIMMHGGKGTYRARRAVNRQYARAGFAKLPNRYQRLMNTSPKGSVARAMQQVPLTKAGKAVKAANLAGMSHPAASRALARATAGVAIGGALLAYDAYKALDAYSKTSGPKKQMAKYKAKGGFSHMTSNPNKRGKSGVEY